MRLPRGTVRRPNIWLGVIAGLMALFVQLSAATAVPQHPVADAFAAAMAETICHVDDGQPGQSAPDHQKMPDCAVCPVCQAMVHPPLLPAPPAAFVPVPRASIRLATVAPDEVPVRASRFAPASARGPPAAI